VTRGPSTRETFGRFDAVASLGAFEHFCSPEEYRAGRQERDLPRALRERRERSRHRRALLPAATSGSRLLNATLAVLLATLDGSITIIAMPDIFRGIHLDPLVPANSFYLLWMILGYLVVTSVLIVSLGRLGDMVGRVKIYRLGFVIYTVASLLLAVDWMQGRDGART
jgi:hypothetical protein